MGTRLYPRTESSEILEKLAGVPTGTHAALIEFESAPENQYNWGDGEKGYEVYCRRKELKAVDELDGFITYGWGKLNNAALGVLKRWGLERETGTTTNPIVVRALITSMEIDLKGTRIKDLKGLSWG